MLNALAPKHDSDWLTYFWSGPPTWIATIEVATAALRWLVILMTGKFLLQSILNADNPPPKLRKLLLRCNLFVALLFLALVALPFLDPL